MLKYLNRKLEKFLEKPLSVEERYLSQSSSREQLERRQREIATGNAPWQLKSKWYL